jgi:hypothetical protein
MLKLVIAWAPGLTPKAVLEQLGAIQMPDVWLPTTDGRWLVMPRYTQPELEQQILLHKLQLRLPQPPPPTDQAGTTLRALEKPSLCGAAFQYARIENKPLNQAFPALLGKFG